WTLVDRRRFRRNDEIETVFLGEVFLFLQGLEDFLDVAALIRNSRIARRKTRSDPENRGLHVLEWIDPHPAARLPLAGAETRWISRVENERGGEQRHRHPTLKNWLEHLLLDERLEHLPLFALDEQAGA